MIWEKLANPILPILRLWMASPAIFHIPGASGVGHRSWIRTWKIFGREGSGVEKAVPSGLWLSESEVFDAHVSLSQNVGIPCTIIVPWYTRFYGLKKWKILWGTTYSDTSMYWTLSGDSSFHNRTVCRPNFWTLLSPNSPCRESFSCEQVAMKNWTSKLRQVYKKPVILYNYPKVGGSEVYCCQNFLRVVGFTAVSKVWGTAVHSPT
jgi:hypothetical protein